MEQLNEELEVDEDVRPSEAPRYRLERVIPGEGAHPQMGLLSFREWRESETLLAVAVPGGFRTTAVATGIEEPGADASVTQVDAVHHAASGWVRLELSTHTFTYSEDTVEGPEEDTFCDIAVTRSDVTREFALCRLEPSLACRFGYLGSEGGGLSCEAFCDPPRKSTSGACAASPTRRRPPCLPCAVTRAVACD